MALDEKNMSKPPWEIERQLTAWYDEKPISTTYRKYKTSFVSLDSMKKKS